MKVMKVRLVDEDIFPPCGKIGDVPKKRWPWEPWRGSVIEIGKPVKATGRWNCGTDVVFPVLGGELMAHFGFEPGYYFVCRHQIQAGD